MKRRIIFSFLARDLKKVSELRNLFQKPPEYDLTNAKRYLVMYKDHDLIKETFHLLVLVLKEMGFQDYEILDDDELLYIYLIIRHFRRGFLIKPLSKLFPYKPQVRELVFYLLFLCALKHVFVDVRVDNTLYSLVAFWDYLYVETLLQNPEVRDIF